MMTLNEAIQHCIEKFDCTECGKEHEQLAEWLEELKRFKDLQDQGRLLELPCAVGDTVYAYCGEFGVLPYEVDCIVIDENITYQCSSYSKPIGDCPSECLDEIEPDMSDFGKTVFLSRKEAEKALESKAE